MAESILRIRGDTNSDATGQPLVVVIVGVGHVGHGLGIPARLKAAAPDLNVRIVAPVMADKPDEDQRVHPGFVPKETATFSRGYADYVYVLPDGLNVKAYPDFGVRMSVAEGTPGVRISSLTPGGIGERAGLKKGDRIVTIDRVPIESVAKASYELAGKRWDDIVVLDISREEKDATMQILDVRVCVVAPTDGEDDALKSSVAPTKVVSFDPKESQAYVDERKQKPEGLHTRIVTLRNKPVRIDVMNGKILEEAWKLDDAGRPVMGLFAKPAPDGAVRVELTRDETGKVTGEKRVGMTGEPVVQ